MLHVNHNQSWCGSPYGVTFGQRYSFIDQSMESIRGNWIFGWKLTCRGIGGYDSGCNGKISCVCANKLTL